MSAAVASLLSVTTGLLLMLDVGHMPEAPGARSARGRPEYEFNREMVALLERQLAGEAGLSLGRTRAESESLELKERARRANRRGARLLLSVHHDSVHPEHFAPWHDEPVCRVQSRAARGFSLHVRGDQPESVRIARAIARALLAAGFRPTPYHAADHVPVDLALGIYDRRRLQLLNAAEVPAVLLECGFIIEPDEELALRSDAVRLRIAQAVAAGVRTALGLPSERARRGPEAIAAAP